MSLRSRIRGGQDYLTVNGATAAQFLTLRLIPIGSTQVGCDDSDGPGHAPRYLDVRQKTMDNNGLEDCEPLNKSQIREIRRRIKEMNDPTRYVVGDPMFSQKKKRLRGFFYVIEDDVFGMEPTQGTPIKSIAVALAIRDSLNKVEHRKETKSMKVYKCRITKTKKLMDFTEYKGSA